MKFVTCPSLGRRALSEFTYGGRLEREPDQETVSEKEWADYVFYHNARRKPRPNGGITVRRESGFI